MNNEFEYYLIDRENNPNYPALDFKDVDEKDIFFEDYSDESIQKIEMCLWSPKPKKPELVDFHSAASVLAFGKRIYDILTPLQLHNVQFVPASVEVKKGMEVDGYWLMHNYNRVECMDMEKSDCEISPRTSKVSWIRKIVLSPEKLSKVPLEERLFFRMKESFSRHLVHKSIVDMIMGINPKGVKFTPVEAWKQGMQFDE
ncbi:MAG: hypothetical protein LBU76_05975 [Azoarcus sp.]|jgi:hypothetical protein|nr:hypothetical protein [Azoarcus sp.]